MKENFMEFISVEARERALKPGVCNDCGGHGGSYMVSDDVWNSAWPEYKEIRRKLALEFNSTPPKNTIWLNLCLHCIEERLGRHLSLSDFTPAPLNDAIRFGYRMGRRSDQ